jgi:hypothetical protein
VAVERKVRWGMEALEVEWERGWVKELGME